MSRSLALDHEQVRVELAVHRFCVFHQVLEAWAFAPSLEQDCAHPGNPIAIPFEQAPGRTRAPIVLFGLFEVGVVELHHQETHRRLWLVPFAPALPLVDRSFEFGWVLLVQALELGLVRLDAQQLREREASRSERIADLEAVRRSGTIRTWREERVSGLLAQQLGGRLINDRGK